MPDTSSTSTLPPACARNHLVANRPLWDSTSVRLPRGKRRLPESSCSTSPTSVVRQNSIGRAPLDRTYLRKDDPRGPSTPPMVMPETPGAVVDRDLDYAATVQLLEHRDWAMFERLQGGGLRVPTPQDAAAAGKRNVVHQPSPKLKPQLQSTAARASCGQLVRSPPSENDLFALDM